MCVRFFPGEIDILTYTYLYYIPSGYLTSPWYRWPIEIDGLSINSMVIFHGKLLNNQMVNCLFDLIRPKNIPTASDFGGPQTCKRNFEKPYLRDL